jgi:hypothetical protein
MEVLYTPEKHLTTASKKMRRRVLLKLGVINFCFKKSNLTATSVKFSTPPKN